MTKITRNYDFQSPENFLIEGFVIAFLTGNGAHILAHVAEDVCVKITGQPDLHGKLALQDYLAQERSSFVEIMIHLVASRDDEGAVYGAKIFDSEPPRDFCTSFKFNQTGAPMIAAIDHFEAARNEWIQP
ncbi:MAG: hypothetical protein H6657_20500 [Ardenticatenaceae bacterium]|nr:hypothetical protein [Ardenticatenaceae bacterium]